MVDKAVSDWMRKINGMRKHKVGGFADPKVQAKIKKLREEQREKEDVKDIKEIDRLLNQAEETQDQDSDPTQT